MEDFPGPVEQYYEDDNDSDEDLIIDVDKPIRYKQPPITLEIDTEAPILVEELAPDVYNAAGQCYKCVMHAHVSKSVALDGHGVFNVFPRTTLLCRPCERWAS